MPFSFFDALRETAILRPLVDRALPPRNPGDFSLQVNRLMPTLYTILIPFAIVLLGAVGTETMAELSVR